MKRGTDIAEIKRGYARSGLYQKFNEQALDGRTNLSKLIRELKKELTEYVGESTIAAEMLIQRIVYKHLRLSQYENTFIENPKNEEKQHYIPLANSLRLDLQALKELAGKSTAPPDLRSYLKNRTKEGNEDE